MTHIKNLAFHKFKFLVKLRALRLVSSFFSQVINLRLSLQSPHNPCNLPLVECCSRWNTKNWTCISKNLPMCGQAARPQLHGLMWILWYPLLWSNFDKKCIAIEYMEHFLKNGYLVGFTDGYRVCYTQVTYSNTVRILLGYYSKWVYLWWGRRDWLDNLVI